MQKIAIFGGTGMTGQCVVAHALKKGLKLRLLVRDMKTVPHTFRDKVEIVMGDVTDYSKVLEVIQGTNGVVVTLGTRNNLEPTTVLSSGLENILKAMQEASVQKISVCLSSFLFYEPDKVPTIFEHINLEHRRMLDLVKSAEFAEWRAVLPPHIADEPSAEFQVLQDKSPGRTISKLDLGKFLVDCLTQEQYIRRVLGIATVKRG
ncbi:flavin reductase (NADPH)-like [Phlebotomus papatasi]|uniref:flavin reductase (NADPH)-like n=1 Tax=Phlebotomus papatasi TaxID=29031 RepID=UPI0024846025|nr:flavin reductase (NADPH)-like [Phlebotomus papatasi]